MAGAPLVIEAIADPVERAVFDSAADQLRYPIAADGTPCLEAEFHLRYHPDEVDSAARPAAIIRSLLPEAVNLAEPFDRVADRLTRETARLAAQAATVLLCTVFRKASEPARLERIRRLNRLAADLSHDFGAGVIDIDRDFAHLGARGLRCDYRPTSPFAIAAAGHLVAAGLIAFAPALGISPEIEQRAREVHSQPEALLASLRRRTSGATPDSPHGPA